MQKDLRFADHFLFTQQSLSTFDHCPLKFRKRYLENLKWDNFPEESIKKRLERGNDFHLLAHRYFMGVPTGLEDGNGEYGELKDWIENLESCFPKEPFHVYLPEYKLRMVSERLKLEANFDLVIIKEGAVEIWDWKTNGGKSLRNNSRTEKRYAESLQTIVYMFVLKEQISRMTGKPAECEHITMHYWQPEPPHLLAVIRYSRELHEKFREILEEKTDRILKYDYACFDKALYSKHCRYCEFNWFCNNDRVDLKLLEEDDELLEGLEWDSVEEKF